jgi:hypothetical protein
MRTPRAVALVEPNDGCNFPRALLEHVRTGNDIVLAAKAAPNFAVKGLIEETDVGLMSGEEKLSRKTMLVIDLTIARIIGGQWLGFDVTSCLPRGVLAYSPETGFGPWGRRFDALCRGRGVDTAEVAKSVFVMCDRRMTLIPIDELESVENVSRSRTQVAALKMFDDKRRKALRESADALSDIEANKLGPGTDLYRALLTAGPGFCGMLSVDTLRQAFAGDENSSRDASRFTQANRELTRALGCFSLCVHHTSKNSQATTARAARGSVELTAAPDVLMTIDTSGEHPTMHFTLRNHESPEPVGFELVTLADGGLRIEVRDACARGKKGRDGVESDDVLSLLEKHKADALTLNKVRVMLAGVRGGKAGAKTNYQGTLQALDALCTKGLATKVAINVPGKESFWGYRFGTDATPDDPKHFGGSGVLFDDVFNDEGGAL